MGIDQERDSSPSEALTQGQALAISWPAWVIWLSAAIPQGEPLRGQPFEFELDTGRVRFRSIADIEGDGLGVELLHLDVVEVVAVAGLSQDQSWPLLAFVAVQRLCGCFAILSLLSNITQ